jgi:hypothetical protein
MKKKFVFVVMFFLGINCRDNSERTVENVYHPLSVIIGKQTYYVNEQVQFQIQTEKDCVYISSCIDLGINAILERCVNAEWYSVSWSKDSVFDKVISEGMVGALVLIDSGYFRIKLPYHYLGHQDNVFSECFVVLDTVRQKIGITTEKITYSANDEKMIITISNHTDSTIYFTSCNINTNLWVWELKECGSWSGYWGNGCYMSPQWHSVPPDSLYNDEFWAIYMFEKGAYRIEYNFYDVIYSQSRRSVYSNVFIFE